ncbi:MAG: hypothetical protein IIT51_08870 [Oscillospiraceae bacterium]|nr:hypothetical protein [Oscillospiraceae bacterium]
MKKDLTELIYGAALRTAGRTKEQHFRRWAEAFNRDLAEKIVCGWDEKDRREQYRLAVLPYWKRYGRRPKSFWFELAGSRDHDMDPRYIPSDLYYLELLPYLNNFNFARATEDKNYLDLRFPDVKQAKTVCRRMAGEYYDGSMELIRRDDAVRLCREHPGTLFIKPSVYAGFGRGIRKFDPAVCTEKTIRDLFEETGVNFIVQEKIRQHASLAALNPDSVSTVRILSLFLDGKVSVTNMFLRVGVPGTDHVTVGSEYNAEILPDGHVSPKVCLDEGRWLDSRSERVIAEDFVLPGAESLRALVQRIHPRVGQFKWIGWDLTVDEDGDPLLIEINTCPGDSAQRVCGRPLFGELTDRVLEDYFFHRTLEKNQRKGSFRANEDIRLLLE